MTKVNILQLGLRICSIVPINILLTMLFIGSLILGTYYLGGPQRCSLYAIVCFLVAGQSLSIILAIYVKIVYQKMIISKIEKIVSLIREKK